MNKTLLLLASVLLAWGCSKEHTLVPRKPDVLATARFAVSDAQTRAPFSGFLFIYPCNPNSSVYFGNYRGTPPALSVIQPNYIINNGSIADGGRNPVLLPVGPYNFVYWGESTYTDSLYDRPAVKDPSLVLGADLSKKYLSLFPYYPDTVYHPVFDYAFRVQEGQIGTDRDEIPVQLDRVVAGLVVIVRDKNGTPLDASIDSMLIHVGGIAESLNFYTAQPVNQTKTVLIPLRFSADRSLASNNMALLFPSAPNPPITVFLLLKSGERKTYTTRLTNPLRPNNRLTVDINIGTIYSSTGSGNDFEVSQWTESNETINTGDIQ